MLQNSCHSISFAFHPSVGTLLLRILSCLQPYAYISIISLFLFTFITTSILSCSLLCVDHQNKTFLLEIIPIHPLYLYPCICLSSPSWKTIEPSSLYSIFQTMWQLECNIIHQIISNALLSLRCPRHWSIINLEAVSSNLCMSPEALVLRVLEKVTTSFWCHCRGTD